MSKLYAGAAKVCITPPAELIEALKCSGNAFSSFDGVYHDIYVRVIAVSDGTRRSLLVASEGGIPTTDGLLAKIKETVGVEADAFLMGDTHNHSCPMARIPGGPMPAGMTIPPEIEQANRDLLDWYHSKVVEAAAEAVSKLEPARVGYISGESYLNVSRDWPTPAGALQNSNFHSYSDKELILLRFERTDGSPIALLANYGMHNNFMFANRLDGSLNKISGDIAGEISEQVEWALGGGVVCGWVIGAAGDQNPIITGFQSTPRVDRDGTWRSETKTISAESAIVLLEHLASVQALELLELNGKITQFSDKCELRCALRNTEIPGKQPVRRQNGALLGKSIRELEFEDGEPVPFRMQLIILNDIAFAGINCELYSRLGRQIKDALPQNKVVVFSAQCPSVGYMPDHITWEIGGFGTSGTRQKNPWDMEHMLYETYLSMEKQAH